MERILFVCTGNTCRSPMAEGLYNKKIKDMGISNNSLSFSRGIATFDGAPASQNAAEVMKKMGVDITKHLSKKLTFEDIESADLVLAMTNIHKSSIVNFAGKFENKIYTIYEYARDSGKDVLDPFGGDLEEYEKCALEISSLIEIIVEKLN